MIKTTKKRTWAIYQLKEAVQTSTSRRQVLLKLGLRAVGGNYSQVKRYIEELQLNTDHFLGQGWNKGLKLIRRPVYSLQEIMVQNSYFQSYKLRNRLFKEGLKEKKCEECGWSKESPDGRLPLELEHINGNSRDHRLSNLKILCPNCHSMTATYRKRK